VAGPGVDTLGEPKSDLGLGGLDSVGAVADVSSDINGEVAADRAGGGVSGLGGTEHHAASLDGSGALPHHAAHGAGKHVVDEALEEALGRQVGVVLLEELAGGGRELHGLKLEAYVMLEKVCMCMCVCVFFRRLES